MKFTTTLYIFIISHLKKHKRYLFLSLITIMLYSFEISIIPYFLSSIIDILTLSSILSNKILVLIGTYTLISLFFNLILTTHHYCSLSLYPKLKANITKDVFSHTIRHSYSFFQNTFTGNVTKKIVDLPANIETLTYMAIDLFIPMIVSILIAIITVFFTVHKLAALILAVWSCLFIYFSYINTKRLQAYSIESAGSRLKTAGYISDTIANIVNLKLFFSHKYEIFQLDRNLKQLIYIDQKVLKQNMKISFFQEISITILISSMLIFSIYCKTRNWITIGDLTLLITISLGIFANIRNIGFQLQHFIKTIGIAKQSMSIIQQPNDIIDSTDSTRLKVKNGTIEFKNVSFNYKNKGKLFHDFNIILNPKEKIGLVGVSGSGKSTFIRLILRLLEPKSGSVLIDNQDIAKVTLESLTKTITTIPQDPLLFHRTIMENIKFAKSNSSNKDVILACEKAKCHEFISELTNGYKSFVGEKGIKLSGGQKQRLAIARAFLKNSPILLLDEATSSLDSLTELQIQKSLYDIMKAKTVVVIAHRLSTLKHMDRILVFDNGRIIEDGRPHELLNNKNTAFAKLWKIQNTVTEYPTTTR